MAAESLNARLLAAHAQEDWAALIHLYTEAADAAEAQSEVDAACFYLTHAFVFALQEGAAQADALNLRLVSYGRDLRQSFGRAGPREECTQ